MKREKSCGGIVFTRKEGRLLYLLIQSRQGVFGFPKGHMERGETERETALREIREETGLSVNLLNGFRETDLYVMHRKGNQSAVKLVVYFLGEFHGQEPQPQESEVSEIVLLPFAEALERLSFDSAKELLKLAEARLSQKSICGDSGKQPRPDSTDSTDSEETKT